MDRGRWLAVLAVVDGPPAVADTPEDQAPEPNLAMLKVWAEYAKERFKGGGHSHWRVSELGSPARSSHRRGHRTGGDPHCSLDPAWQDADQRVLGLPR